MKNTVARLELLVGSLIVIICLTACSPRPHQMSRAEVEVLSEQYGYVTKVMAGGCFTLLTVAPKTPPVTKDNKQHNVLRVYIEGDGLAWRTRRRLSTHPTPVNPLALRLMLTDSTTDKLYIARPCQFIQTDCCNPRFWSTDRYHSDVVQAVAAVLSRFKQTHGYTQVELIGFSGGGTVALLVAAERNDVLSVRTVSGNLDTTEFCRLHHVTPLSGSLNPIDFAAALQWIPQLHFVGAKDSIVPITIFNAYIEHFSDDHLIKAQIVANTGHGDGWIKQWNKLLQQPLPR